MFVQVECSRPVLTIPQLGIRLESSVVVNDEQFHRLRIERQGCRLAMTIDAEKLVSDIDKNCFDSLGVQARLYLGSTKDNSPEGFIGCVNNLLVDDQDRSVHILVDDSNSGVEEGCYRIGNSTIARPCDVCQNGAPCTSEVTGMMCDCSHTDRAGPTCTDSK